MDLTLIVLANLVILGWLIAVARPYRRSKTHKSIYGNPTEFLVGMDLGSRWWQFDVEVTARAEEMVITLGLRAKDTLEVLDHQAMTQRLTTGHLQRQGTQIVVHIYQEPFNVLAAELVTEVLMIAERCIRTGEAARQQLFDEINDDQNPMSLRIAHLKRLSHHSSGQALGPELRQAARQLAQTSPSVAVEALMAVKDWPTLGVLVAQLSPEQSQSMAELLLNSDPPDWLCTQLVHQLGSVDDESSRILMVKLAHRVKAFRLVAEVVDGALIDEYSPDFLVVVVSALKAAPSKVAEPALIQLLDWTHVPDLVSIELGRVGTWAAVPALRAWGERTGRQPEASAAIQNIQSLIPGEPGQLSPAHETGRLSPTKEPV